MTGELHSIIVGAAIKALRSLRPKERQKLLGEIPYRERDMKWIEEHPTFRSKSEDDAMKYIERASKELKNAR